MSERPRVLFVDHSAEPGGGQLGLLRYLLQTREISASVVTLGPGSTFDALRDIGISVKTISSRDGIAAQFRLARRLRREIVAQRPDAVVSNSTRASAVLAASGFGGSRGVIHMRDDLNPERNSAAKRVFMTRFVLPRYDGIIANSQWTLSTVPAPVLRSKPTRVAHPVSGTVSRDQGTIQRADERRPLRLLSLSRLDRWKGIHVALEALRLLDDRGMTRDVIMTVAGASHHASDAYAQELHELARRTRIEVKFAGHVTNTAPLLEEADVLLCLSTTPEPFGQVVVQGLAAGCVVIATDFGGPAEILSENAGVLVPPEDSRAVADQIERLVDDPTVRRAYATRGLRRAQDFVDDLTVKQMDQALLGFLQSTKIDKP